MVGRLLVNSWKIFIYLNLSFEQMNINGTYYHPTFFIRVIVEFVGLCWALSSSSLYGTENSFCVKEKSL